MSGIPQELVRASVYKRSQGRIVRQVTFAALVIILAIGLWRLFETMITVDPTVRYAVPGVLLLAGVWITYRLVNIPRFADFLIAVEAEMNKVSWPSRGELVRASIVVLITIIALAFVLAFFDLFWRIAFTALGILPK